MSGEGWKGRWLNRTVIGAGAASFLSDACHETATSLLPLLAADLGAASVVLGATEGLADAASGAAKLWSGWLTDRLRGVKAFAVAGYVVTAVCTALLGAATSAWQMVGARSLAWAGRGARTPPRNVLLAAAIPPEHYGKAFGLERALDTAGAVVGPLAAAALVVWMPFRTVLWWTILPGLGAALAVALLVVEKPRPSVSTRPFLGALAALPGPYRRYLLAVGLFGLGDFAHSLLILRAIEILTPALGGAGAAASAMGLYALHNACGALLAFGFGAAGDRFGRVRTLGAAYLLGPLMILFLILPGPFGGAGGGIALTIAFLLGGALLAAEDALESAAAAEILPEEQRGMGFGALAAVNSAGDLVSSLAVGALWQILGPSAAFGIAIVPMIAGSGLLGRAVRGR